VGDVALIHYPLHTEKIEPQAIVWQLMLPKDHTNPDFFLFINKQVLCMKVKIPLCLYLGMLSQKIIFPASDKH
jgi:hypothetical protein